MSLIAQCHVLCHMFGPLLSWPLRWWTLAFEVKILTYIEKAHPNLPIEQHQQPHEAAFHMPGFFPVFLTTAVSTDQGDNYHIMRQPSVRVFAVPPKLSGIDHEAHTPAILLSHPPSPTNLSCSAMGTTTSPSYVVVFHSWLLTPWAWILFQEDPNQHHIVQSQQNTAWDFWLHRWSLSYNGCGQPQEAEAIATILCQQNPAQRWTMPSKHFHDRC